MPAKKIKDLKTSQLLDQVEDVDDDSLFDDLTEELYKRIPFEYLMERIEELEKGNENLQEEIGSLRRTLKAHAHLDGKAVVEI